MTRTRLVLGSVAMVVIVAMVTISIIKNNQVNDDYMLIRELVQNEKITGLVTETKDLDVTECYPQPGKSAICKQIQYRINDVESCTKIAHQLLKSDEPDSDCQTLRLNRTFKSAQFTYYLSSRDGEDVLYVTYVSRD